MNQSENINELVAALSKAQAKMKPAIFNKINPHFKSRYADFTSCMDACREPLGENGLCIMQCIDTIADKTTLVTMLAHSSGQWIRSFFPLIPKSNDSQAFGSALTYGKRYGLSALLGIVSDEDDDANAACGDQNKRPNSGSVISPIQPKKINKEQFSLLSKKLDLVPEVKAQIKKWALDQGINDLMDLPESSFPSVMNAVDKALASLEVKSA